MNLSEKVLSALQKECKLDSEAEVHRYVMNRREQIIKAHIENVFPIREPGEKGGDPKKFFTKLTPKNRNHDGKIRASTREELEDKIVAHYLQIQKDESVTVREILLKAVDENTKTGRRTVQRFDKRLASLAKVKISSLDERAIRNALDAIAFPKDKNGSVIEDKKISMKEFNQTITALNKIASYCAYEHIEVCNIQAIVQEFRNAKLTGKHIFKQTQKQTKNLVFTRPEASRIVRNALRCPSYKSFAVAIMITTGLRVGELLGLELDDIYLEDGYLWIHQVEDTKTYKILDYVKENKAREVYLTSDACEVIRRALDFRMADSSLSPFLLLNENSEDGKLHLRAVDDYMRTHVHEKVLGLGEDREARSPHDCRRTYATLEHLNGTDLYDIQQQLGHSSIKQTEAYIHSVVEASERQSRLRGTGLLSLDAVVRSGEETKRAQ